MGYAVNRLVEPKPDRLRVENGRLIFVPNGKDIGSVYQEVDGYYVFWPDGVGFWESHMLREIADLLDAMNEPWDTEVRNYFEQMKENES